MFYWDLWQDGIMTSRLQSTFGHGDSEAVLGIGVPRYDVDRHPIDV